MKQISDRDSLIIGRYEGPSGSTPNGQSDYQGCKQKERGNKSPRPVENIQILSLPPTPAIPGTPLGTCSKYTVKKYCRFNLVALKC